MPALLQLVLLAVASSCAFFPPHQDKPELFVVEPGEHEILQLIQRSGQFLARTYLVDRTQAPDMPAYKIQIDRRLELDRQACEEVIGQMLLARGWVAMPLDVERGIYDWIWISGPRQADLRRGARTVPAAEIRSRPRVVDYVATTVRLEHANAQLAAANLRQWFGDPRGLEQILPLGGDEVTHLLIIGLRPSVASILAVLKEVDVPDPSAPSLEKRLIELEARLQKVEAALKEK